MTTLTAQLGQRSANHSKVAAAASSLSLESDIVDLIDESNAAVDEVADVSTQITAASDDVVTSTTGADSLSALVDNTVAIYGDAGIPEDAAKQLEVSVEAVLRVMGHPGGFSSVLPSVESCTPTQYSTEAEEKKNGVISRIWEWIKKMFGQMLDFFTGMVDKIRNSTTGLTKLTAKLKEKVNQLEGADAEGDVSLGSYGKLCNPKAPVENLVSSKNYFTTFIGKWEGYFGELFTNDLSKDAFKKPETAGAAFSTIMAAEQKKLPEWEKVPVTSYHVLVITKGTNAENPVIGAKAKIELNLNRDADKHPALTKAKMLASLSGVEALLTELETATKAFEKYKANLTTLKQAGFSQRVHGAVVGMQNKKDSLAGNVAKEMAVGGQVLQGLARIGIDGLSQSVPAVLDVIRANLTYVNKSAAAHSKAKPAEKAGA